MKLTIEFDAEWWRLSHWLKRNLCDWFGHPGWRPPATPTYYTWLSWAVIGGDERLRCVRCGRPDSEDPLGPPQAYTHSFSGLGGGA